MAYTTEINFLTVLEVRSLGASMVGFCGEISSCFLLADGHLFPVYSHGPSCLFILRPPILSEEDPTYMVAFNLNYLLKTHSPDPGTLKFNA